MQVHFYGRLAEIVGRDMEIDVGDDCSIAELREHLGAVNPHAAHLLGPQARACVGDAFVNENYVVRPGDRVEFLPLVSGG